MSEWLNNLKEGDEVAVRRGYTYANYEVTAVERTTPKQVVVRGMRFWLDSGKVVGDALTPVRIVEPTPEIREQAKRQGCLTKLGVINWERLDTETLEKIVALLPQESSK